MTAVRLQKLLAAAGAGSRRECETFITDGRVHVDGTLVTELGTKVDPDTQEVRLDGERLSMPTRRTWLLNKPKGVICSARGRPDLPMVGDFAPPEARGDRLFTVGRLDVESEGAILLTNDGELCHRVSHPRFGVEKTYRVTVRGVPDDETLEKMRKGVWLAEGRTGALQIRCLERRRDKAVLEMRVREGMKREIRRICARFGHEVQRLVRVAIGPVQLGKLGRGDTRPLTAEEEAGLRQCADVVIKLGSKQPVRRGTADARRSLAKDPAAGPRKGGPAGRTRGKRGGLSGGRGAGSGRRGRSASGGRRFGKGGRR